MLEQDVYQFPRTSKKVYRDSNLESLSSVALYSGEKIFLPNGKVVSGDALSGYETPDTIRPSLNLTIRDFPALEFQMHIHENPSGKAKLKDYNGEKLSELNSYDAAMADGGAKAYNAMEQLFENPAIKKMVHEYFESIKNK